MAQGLATWNIGESSGQSFISMQLAQQYQHYYKALIMMLSKEVEIVKSSQHLRKFQALLITRVSEKGSASGWQLFARLSRQ
jgi:hypothetical protein